MKYGVILFFLFISSFPVLGQDLIVTIQGDSVNCKIIEATKSQVFYQYKDGASLKSNVFLNSEVSSIIYDYYYLNPSIRAAKQKAYRQPEKIKIGLMAGYGYRTSPIEDGVSPSLQEHFKKLRNTWTIEPRIVFYVEDQFGIGLSYSRSESNSSLDNVNYTNPTNNVFSGNLNHKMVVSYFGPSLQYRLAKKKVHFIVSASIGIANYKENANFEDGNFEIKGSTSGAWFETGIDLPMRDSMLLSLAFTARTAKLLDIQYKDPFLTKTYSADDSLSMIEIKVGFHFGIQ